MDLKDFDMSKIEHACSIVGLQTPQPIEEVIQPINVIRGCPIRAIDVVAMDDSDDVKQEDGNVGVDELDISFYIENYCLCQNKFNLKCYKSIELY